MNLGRLEGGNIAEAAVEVLVVVAIMALAVAIHALIQRRFTSDVLRRHNDVAGFIFAAVGVIYAVVLGFVVVVVWEKHNATEALVQDHINAISDLYRVVGGLPDPVRSQVRTELRRDVSEIIKVEWPQMSSRRGVPPIPPFLETMAHQITVFAPKTQDQAIVKQLAMAQTQRLFDSRQQGVLQSSPSVPPVLWWALTVGAVTMLSFAFLLGTENRWTQLFMTALLAGLIATLLIVIAEFDAPFSGSARISDDGWISLQHYLPRIP
jgi:tryptophan-rich sensory protein